MSGLDLLLAIAGVGVMTLVVAGMILITPLGQTQVHREGSDPEGSNLSGVEAPRREAARTTKPVS